MKIKTELYGEQIAVNGNLRRLLEKKECKILLSISNDDHTNRCQFVLDREEAQVLINSIRKDFQEAEANGFAVL